MQVGILVLLPFFSLVAFLSDILSNGCNILFYMTRFADKQIIKLQETPDEIPEGGTPHTVSVLMHDKLVDAGKPGDRVEVRIGHSDQYNKSRHVVLVYANGQFNPFFYYRSLEYTGQ